MRSALVTILPMLAAAILVMAGGERLSRQTNEIRTPADRERLFELDDALRPELERLESLYLGHLRSVVAASLERDEPEAAEVISDIAGVRLVRVFRERGKAFTVAPGPGTSRFPEIELEGGDRPLDASRAVVLDEELLGGNVDEAGVWRDAPEEGLSVFCLRPEPGVLAAVLVDLAEVRRRTDQHLEDWLKEPMTPLREAGERVVVEPASGSPLFTTGPEQHGPSASIIPIRTALSDWRIRAWDGLEISRSHDPAVLAVATTIALVLVIAGVGLFLQQRRALRLASDRVSFVNQVSHELGSPLTNLSLNLGLATDMLDSRPNEARRRLGLAGEEVGRLSRLVANVLTFSRRERDRLEISPSRCVPSELVERTLAGFRPALERRGIRIETEIDAFTPVWIDADAFTQITGNLLSNVEKYAAAGGWLGLSCRSEAEHLVLEVRDHGPGIPDSARRRIFEPFERERNRTNDGAGGTGLGLAIGRELARRMGGDLELVESESGAVFRLRIPAPPALSVVSSDVA